MVEVQLTSAVQGDHLGYAGRPVKVLEFEHHSEHRFDPGRTLGRRRQGDRPAQSTADRDRGSTDDGPGRLIVQTNSQISRGNLNPSVALPGC